MISLLQKTSIIESSYDEEDSHYFLENIQKDQSWYSYSSRDYSIDQITSAIESFCTLQATVKLKNELFNNFWTPKPIGAFRYIMTNDNSWAEISKLNPNPGFLVQGAYWSNGFYYLVSNQDFLLEANLFVDLFTKEQYNYQ